MFVFIIIAVVAYLVIKFTTDKKKEIKKIETQGGFDVKYSILIEELLSIPNAKVVNKTNSSIVIAIQDRYVVTSFKIAHGFSDYSIFWEHNSTTFGKHNLHWTFPEYLSQYSALSKIGNDISEYEKKLFKEYL